MKYSFVCFGHENIRARHHKTIEFIKDRELTPRGTCIIGVNADFDTSMLKRFSGRIKILVEVGSLSDSFYATINPEFDDDREIVFRKSNYRSKRTLGNRLDKGASRLSRKIVDLMRSPATKMKVTLA